MKRGGVSRPSTNEHEGKAKRATGPKVNKIFDEDKNELKEEGGMESNEKYMDHFNDDEEPKFVCCGLLGGNNSSDEDDSPEAKKAK